MNSLSNAYHSAMGWFTPTPPAPKPVKVVTKKPVKIVTPEPAKPAPAPAPAPAPEPYFRNEKGWACYRIDVLSEGQCEVASNDCREGAYFERNKAIGEAVKNTLLAVGIVVIALVVAKFAGLFFVVCLGKIELLTTAFKFHEFTHFATRVIVHGATYLFAGLSIQKIWNETTTTIKNHLDYALHLDDQARNAQLRKALFVKPPAPIVPPPEPPVVVAPPQPQPPPPQPLPPPPPAQPVGQ